MLEVRFIPQPEDLTAHSADSLGRNDLVTVEFIFRPARVELPRRAVIGTLEVIPPSESEPGTFVKITPADSDEAYELQVDPDFSALDGVSKILEHLSDRLPELIHFQEEEQIPATRIEIANLRTSIKREIRGNYRIAFIPLGDRSSTNYVKNDAAMDVDLVDHPREATPSKQGLAYLASCSIQLLLQLFRSQRDGVR